MEVFGGNACQPVKSYYLHLYAFIAILVPKLVAVVTPLCPLCTGVSQMNSRYHKPYLKTKLFMDRSYTTEVITIL